MAQTHGGAAKAASSTDIAVVGTGLGLQHALLTLRPATGRIKVTACMANPFLEWTMAATHFLVDADAHADWICGNPDAFRVRGVEYVFDPVVRLDAESKTLAFASGSSLTFKSVIVATGSRMPLFSPRPGASVVERMDEVRATAQAIAAAGTVVVYGGGLCGVELAGDVRAKHPDPALKRVVLLTRNGDILKQAAPPAVQTRVRAILSAKHIDVLRGSAPDEFLNPKFEPGTVPLVGGDNAELAYDVFLPAFAQRPNTVFLEGTGALNEKGQIVANEYLQSTVVPEVFGVATTSVPLPGHPVSSRVAAQATAAAKNALRFVRGQALQAYRDTESPPPMPHPMNVKIGHGRGGTMLWVDLGPPGACCCFPCDGGFPFCPPPCCWCAPGCSTCLGTCGGPAEGEGAAIFQLTLLKGFMKAHHYNGRGQLPPEAAAMIRSGGGP